MGMDRRPVVSRLKSLWRLAALIAAVAAPLSALAQPAGPPRTFVQVKDGVWRANAGNNWWSLIYDTPDGLLIVDPQGRVRWEFPRPGDLAPGQTFLAPDDAFFTRDGRDIVATQEDDQVISVISVRSGKIVYRYGVPGVPGAGPGHLSNPDDAMLTPRGVIVTADIRNCRIRKMKNGVPRKAGTTSGRMVPVAPTLFHIM